MKYNFIGDTHGRINWKDLVINDGINVFLGDYFSPYVNILFKDLKQNFLDIIKFKKDHPETILLIGNHDEDHWHIREGYSRFDMWHVNEISKLFEENKDLFQLSFATNDSMVLATHAGVSIVWYIKYKYNNGKDIIFTDLEYFDEDIAIMDAYKAHCKEIFRFRNIERKPNENDVVLFHHKFYIFKDNEFILFKIDPTELSTFINDLWLNENYKSFNFRNNCNMNDCYGESIQQGPIWIRPETLQETNIFKNSPYSQVVGHTQFPHILTYINGISQYFETSNINDDNEDHIYYTDCLGFTSESLLYENGQFLVNK